MPNPRFIMIGGFLGAGKTTSVGRLARHYMAQGKRVVIVTNDQTTDLVDTHNLRSQGFDVGEVAGSCFCCNFNELTATVERLSSTALPDVVLAEPVGSCTDLVATVIRPLVQVYGKPLSVAPYGVILKPSHGLKILQSSTKRGFSPQAEYIFRKQLEEADFILVNRVDELAPGDVNLICKLLEEQFPGRPILRISAKSGEGFDALTQFVEQEGEFGKRLMDVDYDVYAEGEAELGWLNGQIGFEAEAAFSLDTFLLQLVRGLQERMIAEDSEVAHLKAIGMAEGIYGVANLVSNSSSPELSLPSNSSLKQGKLIVNARVATDPEILERLVREELSNSFANVGARFTVETLQRFRPGRPVPTHRLV